MKLAAINVITSFKATRLKKNGLSLNLKTLMAPVYHEGYKRFQVRKRIPSKRIPLFGTRLAFK